MIQERKRQPKPIDAVCQRCDKPFIAYRKTCKWCDACKTATWRGMPPIERRCLWCDVSFTIERGAPKAIAGRRYCCNEHSVLGARKSRIESAKRLANGEPHRYGGRPRTIDEQEAQQRKKDGVVARFFRKYPDRLKVCESCRESRVVELAHKTPRKGAWRSLNRNMRSEDVWVLCPTCHKCLDYGIQTIDELGLIP